MDGRSRWSKRVVQALLLSLPIIVLTLASPAGAAMDEETLKRLEEIVQQQQAQIEKQAQAIEDLQKQIEVLRQTAAEPAAAPGQAKIPAGVVQSRGDKVAVELYGQVNRAVLFTDDGNDDYLYFVDNENSSTRIGLNGNVQATEDLSVGTKIEVEFQSNGSDEVNQNEDHGVGENNFRKRHLDLFLESQRLGKLSLGWGDTASNGVAEVDLSGTDVIGYSGVADMAGGHFFYNNAPSQRTVADEMGNTVIVTDPPGLSDVTIGGVTSNLDGLSRDDRIRYDTPKFYGFMASTSAVSGDDYDVALRYAGQLPGVKLAGAGAYADRSGNSDTRDYQYSGSISALTDIGLNLTLAGGSLEFQDGSRDAATYWYGKLGYKWRLFSVGTTALAVDYGRFDDFDVEGDEADTWGLLGVQNFSEWGTEYYLGYRNHGLDRSGTDFEDIQALMTGFRVKF